MLLEGGYSQIQICHFFKKCVFSKYLFSHEEMITWQRMKKIVNYRIYAYSKFQQNRIIFGRVTALLILVPKKEKTVFFSLKQKYWIFRMKFSYNMWNLLFEMFSLNFSQIIAKTNHLEQIQNLTFFDNLVLFFDLSKLIDLFSDIANFHQKDAG